MIGGVSFEPGQPGSQNTQKPAGNTGVQEAIKVLSLRLPKVVGARAMAPQALLDSPGSGGNPRVDSVVAQIMGRMFPTGAPSPSPAPNGPTVTGSALSGTTPLSSMMPPAAFAPSMSSAPRVSPSEEGQRIDYVDPPRPMPPETKTDVTPAPAGGAGDPMQDFLEFLRRNQLSQEPPAPQDAPSI
jgi:hypothetical protein